MQQHSPGKENATPPLQGRRKTHWSKVFHSFRSQNNQKTKKFRSLSRFAIKVGEKNIGKALERKSREEWQASKSFLPPGPSTPVDPSSGELFPASVIIQDPGDQQGKQKKLLLHHIVALDCSKDIGLMPFTGLSREDLCLLSLDRVLGLYFYNQSTHEKRSICLQLDHLKRIIKNTG